MANIARAQLSALKKTAGHCVLHMLVARWWRMPSRATS